MAFAVGVPFLLFDFPSFIQDMRLLRESMTIGSRGLDLSVIPFAGFHGMERPGPNYSLYKRGTSAP